MDTTFGRQMDSTFMDDLRFSKEIKLEEFSKRSVFSRLIETIASVTSRVL
jgi:hypothetical protein